VGRNTELTKMNSKTTTYTAAWMASVFFTASSIIAMIQEQDPEGTDWARHKPPRRSSQPSPSLGNRTVIRSFKIVVCNARLSFDADGYDMCTDGVITFAAIEPGGHGPATSTPTGSGASDG